MRPITSTLIISAAALSLASCASVPSQTDLTSGISAAQIAQGSSKTRLPSDPVCADFYANVNAFKRKANSPSTTKRFFTSLGLNVASAVVANEIIPRGIENQTARVATSAAIGTATSTGGRLAVQELNSSDRADAKIIEVASDIGCPVNIKP